MSIKENGLGVRGKWFAVTSAVLLGLSSQPANADEVGSSACGKAITVRGEVKHHKLSASEYTAVANATDPKIYAEEIYGREFTAFVEGLPEGEYDLEIYFAETYHTAAGKRMFDVFSGNTLLAENLDIFAEVGAAAEYVLKAKVYHLEDSIGGPLDIRFETKRDNAKVNAIRILYDGVLLACVKAVDLETAGPRYPIPAINEPVVYTDASIPTDVRVADLVRRMTLDEKGNQLVNKATGISRLGVPAYDYWNECLHGVARAGHATVFPQAIGMAAMWDTELMHTIADTIATEGRAKNNGARAKNPNTARYYGLTFWTPNINIFRDPRWGRGQETYGEDPYLAGELGVAFITGLQGDDPNYYKALACAKHFAVHSGPEKLRHVFDAVPSERDLYETYLPQFERAVKEGRVGNIMSAYNAVYGIPAPASKFLLTDLLRDQWGFDGHVVSDCGGIRDVYKYHTYVATPEEATAVSILAGNDLNCGGVYANIPSAVTQGLLTEADVDVALSRVLTARFKLGLFDTPDECAYLKIPAAENNTPENSRLSLEAARKSMVLLKNNGVLPLDKKKIKRIAVIGPNAESVAALLGNYAGKPSNPITVLAGIQNEAGSDIEVTYAKGCPLALRQDETYSVSDEPAAEAVSLAKKSDLVLFIGGLDAHLEGEEMRTSYQGFDHGDRKLISLPQPQIDLLNALAETKRPLVFVNMSGSSISIPTAQENVAAVVQAWYPGQNGGTAVADVLFGNFNPAGRLPITFYESTDGMPEFTDYSMKNRTYRYFTGKPLYAFGHGLSYTQFKYGDMQTSAPKMNKDGSISVRVRVENNGPFDGEEVVQLYVRHLNSPVPQAQKSLAGFKRIFLRKGTSQIVEMELPASALRYWDVDADQYVVPSGSFEIQIGAASDDIRNTTRMKIL
ncbi:glycoside hydrolase family 3 C-terminal domain-containing protein [Pontiellaceae bacterium B12219]|nr:glycoside hydrolase family 3 C-terminal domain-containing protein [Pontiellaceae bacterium B12219]